MKRSKPINNNIFLLALIFIFLVKLITIRNSEVVLDNADAWSYIQIAAQKIWFPYSNLTPTLAYPPGYPLFIIFSNLFGFPLRLFQEFFYFFSLGFLIYGLRCLKISKGICILVFFVSIFHPYTYYLFSRILTEGITSSLYIFLVAFTIILFTKKQSLDKIVYSCLCGITIGFILITRPENLILYLYIFLLMLLIIYKYKQNLIVAVKKIIYFSIIPLLIALFMIFCFSILNEIFLGIPSLSILLSPSYMGMISNLQKIDYPSNEKYVTISKAQLEAAYKVSPTLREIKPFIEEHKQKVFNLRGINTNQELRSDWVSWFIYQSLTNSLKQPTLDKQYQVITKINNELKTALQKEKIPSKNILVQSLDSRFQVWVPELDNSIERNIKELIFPPMDIVKSLSFDDQSRFTDREKAYTEFGQEPKIIIGLFDKMANRRTAILGASNQKLIKVLVIAMYGIYAINIFGVISFILLFFYYLVVKQKSYFLSQYCFVVLIISSLQFSRLLFYSVVDASAFPTPVRYLFPLMPLFSGFSLVNIAVTINLLRKQLIKKFL